VKAIAVDKGQLGSIASNDFGLLKKGWKIIASDSETEKHLKEFAIDEDPNTYWRSTSTKGQHYIAIDLGKVCDLKGFAYTPQSENSAGMIEKGIIKTSRDGRVWKVVENFEFGNLINDPVKRRHNFKSSIQTRYIRIDSKVIAGAMKTAAIAELDFYEIAEKTKQ